MVEKVRPEIATGEVSQERWYLLTSLPPGQGNPGELLRLFRNHWSIENNLHHVKDRAGMKTSTRCAVRGWVKCSPRW